MCQVQIGPALDNYKEHTRRHNGKYSKIIKLGESSLQPIDCIRLVVYRLGIDDADSVVLFASIWLVGGLA